MPLLVFIVACGLAAAVQAAPGYTVSGGSLAYTPLSAATANVVPFGQYPSLALITPGGFSMQLFGQPVTDFKISQLGHIQLDPLSITPSNYNNWASSLVIAPCWRPWDDGAAGAMLWEFQAGVLTVEWQNVEQAGYAGVVSFQLRADIATGIIEFRYAPLQGASALTVQDGSALLTGIPGAGSAIPLTFGDLAGFFSQSGGITQWPADSYVRFTPVTTTFPEITATISHTAHPTPQPGDVVNYMEGRSVQSMNLDIQLTHPSGAAVALDSDLWDVGNPGSNMVETQFESTSVATPFTLSPSGGTLVAGAEIWIVMIADAGANRSVLSFRLLGETKPPGKPLVDDTGKSPVFNCSVTPGATSTALAPLAAWVVALLLRRRKISRNS